MWSSIDDRKPSRTAAMLAAVCVCLMLAAGCTTTESDMPWNVPHSWEGSPSIPGLSGGN